MGMTGRKEVCREIDLDKLKLFQKPPDNLEDHQLEPEEIPEEDTDEDATEPTVHPRESRERIDYILCKDEVLRPEDLEDEAIYEEKEGDWGTGSPLGGSRPPIQDEEVAWAPTAIWGDAGPVVLGREPEEAVAVERYPQQNIEGYAEPGASQAQAGGPPQEETEAFQPEIPTGTCPQTEEGSEERDV